MYEYFWKYARNTMFYEELMVMLIEKQINTSEQPMSNMMNEKSRKEYPAFINKIFPANTKRREVVKKIAKKIKNI